MEEKVPSKNSNGLLWSLLIVLCLIVLGQLIWLVNLSRDVAQLSSSVPSLSLAKSKDEQAQPRRMAKVSDLDKINNLMEQGLYEEALKEHLWFHEASRYSAPLAGVRASFALSYWIDLGKRHPPAYDALIGIRDKYREKVLTGNGSFEDTSDLFAIDRALGNSELVLDNFRELLIKSPEAAESVYLFVEDLLIEEKAYDLIGQFINDPIRKYEDLRLQRESSLSFATTSNKTEREYFLEAADESFVAGVTALIETLVELDRSPEAKEIQKRALAYYPSDRISNATSE